MSGEELPQLELHDAIQKAGMTHAPIEGGVLTRWIIVCEWALPDMARSMTRMSGGPDGAALNSWDANGLLHTALFGQRERG